MGTEVSSSSLHPFVGVESSYAEKSRQTQEADHGEHDEGYAQNSDPHAGLESPRDIGETLSALSHELGGIGHKLGSISQKLDGMGGGEKDGMEMRGGMEGMRGSGSSLEQLGHLAEGLKHAITRLSNRLEHALQGHSHNEGDQSSNRVSGDESGYKRGLPSGPGLEIPSKRPAMGGTSASGSASPNLSGGSGPAIPPSKQPAAGGTSAASGSAAPSGNGALGPNVPSALQPFVQEINAAAKQTGVPASLIGAQILQESGGNPNAVTTNPALGLPDTGLMQVDQATFQGLQQQYPSLLGGKSVSDPATNIMAGALLDAQLLKQNNGNIGATLTAYNGSADPSYVNEVTSKMNALQNGTPVPGGFS